MSPPKLNQTELLELLTYDPETGLLRWRIDRNQKTRAGDIAGAIRDSGYVWITIHRKIYRAHRVIWVMMTGVDPVDRLDHKDTDRANNRWRNLREATHSLNLANRGRTKANSSGFKGVFVAGKSGRWYAKIAKDRIVYKLGYFDSREEAHAAYMAKARELYGEFARAA